MRMDDGAAREAAPSAHPTNLRTVHQRMLEAVLGGGGLGEVAELAAGVSGAPVAIVVPRLDAAVTSPGARIDVGALRRYVIERCRGPAGPGAAGGGCRGADRHGRRGRRRACC